MVFPEKSKKEIEKIYNQSTKNVTDTFESVWWLSELYKADKQTKGSIGTRTKCIPIKLSLLV